MTEEQIAALDEYELLTHIRRIQQIANADRELNELLNERRRRQVVAAMGGETEDEREAREEVDRGRENVRHINQFARMLPREIKD